MRHVLPPYHALKDLFGAEMLSGYIIDSPVIAGHEQGDERDDCVSL